MSNRLDCLVALATHPGLGIVMSKVNYSAPLTSLSNGNGKKSPLRGDNCSCSKDTIHIPQNTEITPFAMRIRLHHSTVFDYCVIGNGTKNVGSVPPWSCYRLWTFCPFEDEIAQKACVADPSCKPTCRLDQTMPCARDNSHSKDLSWNATTMNLQHNLSHYHRNDDPSLPSYAPCSGIAPGPKGCRTLTDYWWLCGHSLYSSLPPNWGGICTLVSLLEPTFFLQRDDTTRPTRTKRSLSSHANIPWEYRIWGEGRLFGMSIFPQIGLKLVAREVEINRYALMRVANASILATIGFRDELTQVRLMLLQNRLVLDQLTASQGGVCVIVGSACCTYIPANDDDGGIIHLALKNLTQVQHDLQAATPGITSDGWWLWLSSWKSSLMTMLIPFVSILILFGLIVCCIIPCLRSCIESAMSSMFHRQMLQYAPSLTEVPIHIPSHALDDSDNDSDSFSGIFDV